ncbi:phage tail protein [Saccharicrinis sp. FJH54]|uniref:phage tail protein n=1 Tax=Saccharicrinis sp. FJH54 TaxID=3344665 RepID=UPI0035D51B8D
MKAVYTLLFFFCLSLATIAQSTKGFSFQGYARGADGAALQNEPNLEVKFTLYSGNETNPEFTEDQTLSTNEFGVFQAVIGVVNTTAFDALDFASFDYTLKVEVKDNGAYQTVAKKILLAVPYAKAAESSTRSVVADKVKGGSNGVPPGTIVPYAGTSAPQGWVMCNGGTYNGNDDLYKELYNVIQTTYGGTGVTSFKVPDLRGVFLRGMDNGRGLDNGRNLGSYQADEFKSHTHQYQMDNGGAHTHTIQKLPMDQVPNVNSSMKTLAETSSSDEAWSTPPGPIPGDALSWNGGHIHGLTIYNTGGNETRPVNVAVNYIIKL